MLDWSRPFAILRPGWLLSVFTVFARPDLFIHKAGVIGSRRMKRFMCALFPAALYRPLRERRFCVKRCRTGKASRKTQKLAFLTPGIWPL